MLVLPNEGLADLLAYWIGLRSNVFGFWNLILWNNNITPSQTTVYSDLVQTAFTGYTPVSMDPSLWTSPVISADKSVSTWGSTPTLWTCTSGSDTIYGYALVTPSSPVIRVVERFASPIPIAPSGIIGVLPRLEFTTE